MTSEAPTMHLEWGAVTDRGPRRRVNEDSYLAEAPLFFVADGMGGHESGEIASKCVVDAFRPLAGGSSVDVDAVERAYADAVRAVAQIAVPGRAPGTTLSGVALSTRGAADYWLVLNIGDSRTYRLSGGLLEQISVDHSAVQELVDSGELAEVDAERHPRRHVVTRAVGAGSDGPPDVWLLPASVGDRMLVCSDGLSRELARDEIARALREETAPQTAAERLVHEALGRGARDNVTVLVVDAHAAVGGDTDTRHPAIAVDSPAGEDTVPRVAQQDGAPR